MRKPVFYIFAIAAGTAMLFAQTPPVQSTPVQNPAGQATDPATAAGLPPKADPVRPVDPLEEREKALRKLDPSRRDPTDAEPISSAAGKRSQQAPKAEDPDEVTVTDGSGRPDLKREYTGPAVLTRSYAVDRPSLSESTKFRPYAGVQGIFDTGLAGVSTNPDGTPDNRKLWGTAITYGIDGQHYWKHDAIQLNYSGLLNKYVPASVYNGNNQLLTFDWTHQLTRHMKISVVENASRYTLGYSLTTSVLSPDVATGNVSLANTPSLQILDTTTTQSSSSVHFTWQKSARLSIDMSGTYFLANRSQRGLVNSKGGQTGIDVAYRYSKKTTIGGYYSAGEYRFSAGEGNSFSHTVGVIYSYAFDHRTELRARLGLMVMQNLGITSVSLDPAIAALMGQQSSVIQYYSVTRVPDFTVSLSRVLRGDKGVHLAYTRGTTPGNGIFLASTQEVIDFGYSAALLRTSRLTVGGGRNALHSVSQQVGQYTSNYVRVGLSRRVTKHLQSDLSVDYRKFEVSATPLLRNQVRVSAGFSWSNDQFPAKVF